MKIRNGVYLVLVVLWMILIFSFSARTADLSTEDSMGVGMMIGKMVITDFNSWSQEKQQEFAEKIEYPVRKTAHFMEYAVLGCFLMGSIAGIFKKYRKEILIAWVSGTLYAALDEIHQLFVPGRSGQVSDVILDGCGVCFGVCLMAAVFYLLEKRKRNRKEI